MLKCLLSTDQNPTNRCYRQRLDNTHLKPKYRSINLVFLPGPISGEPAHTTLILSKLANTIFYLWKDLVSRKWAGQSIKLPAYDWIGLWRTWGTCLMAMVSASSWCSCGSQQLGESVWSPRLVECQPLIFSPEQGMTQLSLQTFPRCYIAQVHVRYMVLSAHATGACSLQLAIIGSDAHISWRSFLSTTSGSPGAPCSAVAFVSRLFFGCIWLVACVIRMLGYK